MDYLNENISINLRRIRKSKQMSLDDVSVETGISKSMLGQIERGEANPTIGTLGRIISGLRVSFMDLITSPQNESYLIRKELLSPTKEEKGCYRIYTYFPYEPGRNFEIYSIVIQPDCVYPCSSHGEQTVEYNVVEEGKLYLELGDQNYTLETGNAIRFHTDCVHTYKNIGDCVLRISVVFTWHKY